MDADVVIAGAGPVGLLLAAELRLAGVRPLLLDRLPGPTGQRKARGIGPLAVEALARRGLAEAVAGYREAAEADLRRDRAGVDGAASKLHFGWIHRVDPVLPGEPERVGSLIWQRDLERILAAHAAGLGVVPHWEHTVTGLDTAGDEVVVTVDTPRGTRRIRAGHVVGCDGGRSAVRALAGFDFPGTDPMLIGRIARIEADGPPLPTGRLRTERGIFSHDGERGVVGTFEFDARAADRTPLAATSLQESIRRVTGVPAVVTAIAEPQQFTDYAAQASTYRRGRVLLAGDAAHVHSPNGGQGLTLGLLDAANLGWKLAATVAGTAPGGLLDSYTAERHPVAASVLANTLAQSVLMRPGPHVDALRAVLTDLMELPDVNRYFARMLTGLDLRHEFPYPGNGHPLLGRPCPDLRITRTGGECRLSELTGSGHAVLLCEENAFPAGIPAIPPDRVRLVPVRSTSRADTATLLVRPDGIVAWAARPGEDAGTGPRAALATWFGTHLP
ncbi:FAD-dependent monooxygenase [Amycolatopsis samaneae]|uniref:FAD-dependent monooxygenase n=1 Tax=Amycolatopsis samaneae TaxID=664691 RepID=A0ABW5GRT6_9PSEU